MQTGIELGVNPRGFRHDGRRGGELLLSDTAGALVPHGLWAGQVSILDFFKVGFPLTLLIYGVAIILVPAAWPL